MVGPARVVDLEAARDVRRQTCVVPIRLTKALNDINEAATGEHGVRYCNAIARAFGSTTGSRSLGGTVKRRWSGVSSGHEHHADRRRARHGALRVSTASLSAYANVRCQGAAFRPLPLRTSASCASAGNGSSCPLAIVRRLKPPVRSAWPQRSSTTADRSPETTPRRCVRQHHAAASHAPVADE